MRITLASGAEFEGIYSNGPELTSCRLGMVSQKKLPNSQDISNGAGRREQATMSFQRKEIVEARVVPGNGKSDGKVTNGMFASLSMFLVLDLTVSPRQPVWIQDRFDHLERPFRWRARAETLGSRLQR